MKINYKKIIAREFLFLIGSLLIALIFVLIENNKNEKNIENENELAKISKIDSLPKRLKVYEITSVIDSQNKSPKYITEISKLTGFPNKEIFIENLKDEKIASLFYDNLTNHFEIENDKKAFLKSIKEDDTKSENRIVKISEIKNEINKLRS